MFSKEFIADEIQAIGYICDDESVINEIAEESANIIWADDYLANQIVQIIDSVITNANLPESDEVDW